jgi:superfamily II DNA or RNA helicase
MTRLAATLKMLYYPTQDRILDLLGEYITFTKPYWVKEQKLFLLDPCCGDGAALSFLASIWSSSIPTETWGIELHEERAKKAKLLLDHAYHGSMHQALITGKFHCVLLNPPYDSGGEGERQEVQFLQDATPWLAHNGMLILIIPRKILRLDSFRQHMGVHYSYVDVFDYPSPEKEQFNQVVVIARRDTHGYYQRGVPNIDAPFFPELGSKNFNWETPRIDERPKVRVVNFDPEEWVDKLPGYSTQQWQRAMLDQSAQAHTPLMMPRPGHRALLLAAGQLNGYELRPGLLVKGSSEKTKLVIPQGDEVLEREKIVTRISQLDITNGVFDTWLVHEHQDKTVQWFLEYGDDLSKAIIATHKPLFNGDTTPWAPELAKLRAPGILPGKTTPEFFQLQVEAACAIALRWRKHKNTNVSGEMGVGKTTLGIVASEISKHKKTIVVCPSHLVKKWVRECAIITGQPGVAFLAKKLSDVDRFFAPGAPARFLIISKETAKLGAKWRHAFHVKTSLHRKWRWDGPEKVQEKLTYVSAHCPTCGETPFFAEETAIQVSLEQALQNKTKGKCQALTPVKYGVTTAEGAAVAPVFPIPPKKDDDDPRHRCFSSLWQSEPLSAKGTKRWALAKYVNTHYPRQYSLITDEAHILAKSDSDQARAVQLLESQAVKTLSMTGTIYSGRASGLFHLLYKTDGAFRLLYKYDETQLFVEHHGLFERVFKEEEYTSTYGYKKGKGSGRLREIPGMSPGMIPLLLPSTIFLKLKDLDVELPPYREIVVSLNHDGDVLRQAQLLKDNALAVMRKHPELLGQYLMACLGYPDAPENEENIVLRDEDGYEEVIAHADAIPKESYPKDRYVVNTVKNEKEAGRRVLVFFSQTHKRDARMRVQRLLEAEGLKVVVLDSNVTPEKREEWVAEQVEKGFDVMLTNGRLVETGLDLLFAHTIIQYGTEYSINTLRQSIRRSWRLGQTKPVRVIFLIYADTLQENASNLIARKMRAAEQVDGDEVQGLGSTDDTGANFFVELAQDVFSKN